MSIELAAKCLAALAAFQRFSPKRGKVMFFSRVLLLEMKLGLHTIRLKLRDTSKSGITPHHLQPKISKLCRYFYIISA